MNNVYAIKQAILSGCGIGALPAFMAQGETDLVCILPETLRGPTIDAYFVYPEELRRTQRVEVFRDFLLKEVSDSLL